mmetsp:Transcript_2273/g.6093  ORF Transcript_2273/g.6093 Transcript_2273/m.6093 type:complete len:158 (+) Transcript_2273:462-935(+)
MRLSSCRAGTVSSTVCLQCGHVEKQSLGDWIPRQDVSDDDVESSAKQQLRQKVCPHETNVRGLTRMSRQIGQLISSDILDEKLRSFVLLAIVGGVSRMVGFFGMFRSRGLCLILWRIAVKKNNDTCSTNATILLVENASRLSFHRKLNVDLRHTFGI